MVPDAETSNVVIFCKFLYKNRVTMLYKCVSVYIKYLHCLYVI